MVDLPSPPNDPGAVLEGGFAHRAVILGAQDASRAGGDFSGLSTTVTANGEPFAAEEDPEGAVGGDILGLVRHAADYLGAFGQRLEAGQFLITGSTIAPPPQVEAGQHLVFELGGLGTVEVTLT
jgi:2-keto-4-pentenoate hydratase